MKRWLAAVLALAAASSSAATTREQWPTYVNVLHRYHVCYPAALLVPLGEADNSAGQAFQGADGARLSVFAWYDDALDLAQATDSDAHKSAGAHGRITYRRLRNDRGMASGYDQHGTIFYTITLRRADHWAKADLRYPRSAASRYGDAAKRLSSCFAFSPQQPR